MIYGRIWPKTCERVNRIGAFLGPTRDPRLGAHPASATTHLDRIRRSLSLPRYAASQGLPPLNRVWYHNNTAVFFMTPQADLLPKRTVPVCRPIPKRVEKKVSHFLMRTGLRSGLSYRHHQNDTPMVNVSLTEYEQSLNNRVHMTWQCRTPKNHLYPLVFWNGQIKYHLNN